MCVGRMLCVGLAVSLLVIVIAGCTGSGDAGTVAEAASDLDQDQVTVPTLSARTDPPALPVANTRVTPTPNSTPQALTPQNRATPSPPSITGSTPTPEPPSPLQVFQNWARLTLEHPALALAVEQLGWVQDGVDRTEMKAVESLLHTAIERPSDAAAIVFLGWVQDGVNAAELQAIELLNGFGSSGMTLVVIAMTWVQDGIDADVEVDALRLLSQIAGSPSMPDFTIFSLPWVRDGLEEEESVAIGLLYEIGDIGIVSSIVSLDWVQDGVSGEEETDSIGELSDIARADSGLGSSVIALEWVRQGIDSQEEVEALQWLSHMAFKDIGLGLAVVAMDWVSDGISDEKEVATVKELYHLANEDVSLAESVVSMGWIQDNLDPKEAEAVKWIRRMKGVETASAVVSLDWVQDGIDDASELAAIQQLSSISTRDPGLAASIISFEWLQDGISEETEVDTVKQLNHLANEDISLAESVVSMGWIQDNLEPMEAEAINWMRNTGSVATASAIVSLGWVQDGIDGEVEVSVVRELSYASQQDTGLAQSIASAGWLQDNLDSREEEAVKWLSRTVFMGPAVASSTFYLDWVQDGIDDGLEVGAIKAMYEISYRKTELASALLGMPFLRSIEPPDVVALWVLRWLASSDSEQIFQRVMSSPVMRDGITDELAPVVATLPGVTEANPALIDTLLDPSRVMLETSTLDLPLSGNVVLAIIRTSPGVSRSMDLLERAVRSIESMLDAPLPTNYVGLLFEDAVPWHSGGVNSGTNITIRPEYDADDGSYEANEAGYLIAHEVAHYYWTGNADWIDEGIGELLGTLVEHDRTGRPVEARNWPCSFVRTIAELEVLEPEQAADEFACNYSLGERFFLDLLRVHGKEQFLLGLRELYAKAQMREEADGPSGTALTVGHIEEAFRSDSGATDTVIDRWYHGTEPYDVSHLGLGPSDPALRSINGQVDRAYLSGTDVVGWRHFTLEYSYNVSRQRVEIPLSVVERYEDGFIVRDRTINLTAESRLRGGTQRFYYGPPPGVETWPAGRYTVHVYEGSRQVAQIEYHVER